MRPHFDHWFPKAYYPLLSVSFFNLIPTCNTCNSSVKGAAELDPVNDIHPYVDAIQTDELNFQYKYDGKLNNYDISLVATAAGNTKALDTALKLKIDQMYNAHHEELKDLIKIKSAYSATYIKKMRSFFPSSMSEGEVYRLLFGTEIETSDFHKRPLSKFKSDILKKLGVIK